MSGHPILRIEIENVGPIRSGAFELRPLTLFIGPSNTGKSYAAALAHSIITILGIARRSLGIPSEAGMVFFQMMPTAIVPGILCSSLGCERVQDLFSKFATKEENARVELKCLWEGGEQSIISIKIPKEEGFEEPLLPEPSDSTEFREEVDFWEKLAKALELIPQRSYYLPAARAGALQSWRVMAAARPMKPSGIIKEFLDDMDRAFHLSQREPRPVELSPFQGVLKVLEADLLKGEVDFMPLPKEPAPKVVYRVRAGEDVVAIPVQQVSAMATELAPLILLIKHLLNPGEMLIIEEPEAHLHPESQRRVARALVRLVRAGVTILCTTHSDLILHQTSNHILASRADPARRKELGFTEEDLLREEEVGAYLFQMREDGRGSEIQPLPIVPGFGIPEDEFVRVAEDIGYETYQLAGPLEIELGETPSEEEET